jgi:hypothetical protein
MIIDAADTRTKRGSKLEKERNSARSSAKVWLVGFFLSIILFVMLRVSYSTPSPDCKENGSCECLDMFDVFFTIYLLCLFLFTCNRVKLGCKSHKVITTRRYLKTQSRNIDLVYGVITQILTALLTYTYIKDSLRDECNEDKRF